jgi:Fe-S-cluster containining protein
MPIEAVYTASYLVLNEEKFQNRLKQEPTATGCSFYDPAQAAHCTIYPVRPLICRLFAWSALTNKKGELDYKSCRHMQQREQVASNAMNNSQPLPPLMTLFSHRVAAIQPTCAGERALLQDELGRALQRLNLIRQFYTNRVE